MRTNRQRRTRSTRLGAVLAAASLVAAACGDDSDDDDEPVDTGAAETTDAPDDTEPETTDAPDDTEPDETEPDDTEPDDTDPEGEAGEIEGEAVDDPEVLNIAWLLPQTGDLANIVDALVLPLEMATEEVNAVGHTTVNLFGADDGTDASIASVNAEALLNEQPSAIIGPAGTSVTMAVIERITGEGVLQCSGSNTGAEVTGAGTPEFYFRTAPSDDLQGPALASLINDDGYFDVAVVYRNDDYGVGFAESLKEGLEQGGANIVADIAYDDAAASFDAEAQEIASANPDAVAMISFEEGGRVLSSAIGQGVGPQDDVQWYVADGFKGNVPATDVDPDNPAILEGIRGTAPSAAPLEGEPTFPDRFAEFAGADVPTIFSAQKYDCLITIVLASEIAESTDPAEIQPHIVDVTRDGTPCSTYEECHQLIMDGEDIDYNGASGPIDLDENGDPTVGIYDIFNYDAEGNDVEEEGNQLVYDLSEE